LVAVQFSTKIFRLSVNAIYAVRNTGFPIRHYRITFRISLGYCGSIACTHWRLFCCHLAGAHFWPWAGHNTLHLCSQYTTLFGLGLGVDYSLFMVSRFREELEHGCDVTDAVTVTVATAGRAVAFSGLAVSIAC